MGRIAGAFGVKGWVRVTAFTELPDGLLDYAPWFLRRGDDWREVEVLDARPHGKGLVAQLPDCPDRDAAMALTGTEIGVYRSQLPAAGKDEYYWNDLIGLRVVTMEGREFGTVDHLIETGANDVLVIRGEREILVPFVVGQVIKAVDLEAGVIRVEWDPDY
jgi:16S rRNA processing protein RimM